jgi:hypothetical protein
VTITGSGESMWYCLVLAASLPEEITSKVSEFTW